MDGLLVSEPYATKLVRGEKEIEFRSMPLPKDKRYVKILILSENFAKGFVVFDSDRLGANNIYQWNVIEAKEFSPYVKYKTKKGCIVWVKDVELIK